MSIDLPPEIDPPAPADDPPEPARPAPLSSRGRWLVCGAGFGAFWFSAVPIGVLFLVAQSEGLNWTIILLASAVVGTLFAGTAALIAYLILKP